MAEYQFEFQGLEDAIQEFDNSAKFYFDLKDRLQTKFGSEGSRTSLYKSLLRITESYLTKCGQLRGRDAHQTGIDALAISYDYDRIPSAIDDMVYEATTNYSKLLIAEPEMDKNVAAEKVTDNMAKLWKELQGSKFIKSPYLERFLDMYLERLNKSDEPEKAQSKSVSAGKAAARAVS